ncbi:MAG: 2OG-Fe(II) oxygenase [Sphingobium sp.]
MSTDVIDQKYFLALNRENGFFEFNKDQCQQLGNSLHDQYINNSPFPHIVIDNFIDPDILRQVIEQFPEREKGRFSDKFSQLKTGYSLSQIKSAYIQDLLNVLNSSNFMIFLSKMTGIKGLTNDPYFLGGGLHETAHGGHLSIHADFNIHPHTKLLRRINLILFLNDDWEEEFGGALELWDSGMQACQKSVLPVMARAVIFNTDSSSYHGHPEPLTCPETRFRRSIALYYYTVSPSLKALPHTTVFKARPGTGDQRPSFNERVVQRLKRAFSLRT